MKPTWNGNETNEADFIDTEVYGVKRRFANAMVRRYDFRTRTERIKRIFMDLMISQRKNPVYFVNRIGEPFSAKL